MPGKVTVDRTFIAMWKGGMSSSEMADYYGVQYPAINVAANKAGLSREGRPKRGRKQGFVVRKSPDAAAQSADGADHGARFGDHFVRVPAVLAAEVVNARNAIDLTRKPSACMTPNSGHPYQCKVGLATGNRTHVCNLHQHYSNCRCTRCLEKIIADKAKRAT